MSIAQTNPANFAGCFFYEGVKMSKRKYNIAVVGATGNVGYQMLSILHERGFPVGDIVALASAKSVGKIISFGDKNLKVQNLEFFDFTGTDIVLSSPGGAVSAIYSPKAGKAGAIVIDNTSHFRMDADVPLIVPEINHHELQNFRQKYPKNIIANPNCSTIQMVLALKPLHDIAKIKRVVVATYQSVSGTGKDAMDELYDQTRAIMVNDTIQPNIYPKQIAFNCLPHIDKFMDDGYTKEEWKMRVETNKILNADIKLTATCVRVPVFVSHSEAVNVEFENPISEKQAYAALRSAPGVLVFDKREAGGYMTPKECTGDDSVYISRLRKDETVPNGLSFWCVGDNLRKGAALNAVQIAEKLIKYGI